MPRAAMAGEVSHLTVEYLISFFMDVDGKKNVSRTRWEAIASHIQPVATLVIW